MNLTIILIRGDEVESRNLGLQIAAGKTHVRVISTLDFKTSHNMPNDSLSNRTALSWVRQELMRSTRNATGGEVYLIAAPMKEDKTINEVRAIVAFFEADYGELNLADATEENGYRPTHEGEDTTVEELMKHVG